MDRLHRLVSELRRRKVVRVAVVYGAVAFVLVQVADLVVEPLHLPTWTVGLVILLAALGFPLALVLAWAFELTADGVRRTVPEESDSVPSRLGRSRWWFRGAGAVLVLVVVAWLGVRFSSPPDAAAPRETQIAVLPFTDMSPAQDHEYLADGMTEELIHLLTGVEGLRPIARTSVFALKGTSADVRELGRTLEATLILDGSVRRGGDQLRITAQLVDVTTGRSLWSDSYDRRAEDVFGIQDDIARSIVEALRGQLIPGDAEASKARVEVDLEAYDLYLRGRFLWHRRTGPDLRDALEAFESAVDLAPEFARAHSGLADAYAVLGFYGFLPPREAFPPARRAAQRALALEPTFAPAQATLGYVSLYYDWDLDEAERAFHRAIELDPHYSIAHQWEGNLLTARGRFDEAAEAMRRASELDPLSLIANAALGWVFMYAGEYERALEHLHRTLELDEGYELAHLWRGEVLAELGRLTEASDAIRRAVELGGGADHARAALARVHALQGRSEEARELIRELEDRREGAYLPSYDIARIHEALGDRDAVYRSLDRAISDRARAAVFLRVEPAFQALRGEPRFEELSRRVGLGS
jgi:TolB-like protein/Tfp pilus assembly protein PilF